MLADVVRVGRDRLGFILFVTICVAAAAAAIASVMPVSYSSSAELLLDQHKNKVADLSPVVSDLPNDPVSTQNQIRVLTSRDLAARVIEKLDLANDAELNAEPPSASIAPPLRVTDTTRTANPGARVVPAWEDRVIDVFLKHLAVQPLGLSTTIAVTFTSRDPQTAATVANAVADAYLERQIATNALTAQTAASWLSQRVQKLASDLQGADAAVQLYKRTHSLSEAADGTPLVDQELVTFQSQLVDAKTSLAEKQATRDRLHALAASGDAPDIAQVAASPVIVQLREQEADTMREEADLATRYGPKNPKIIAMDSERKNIDEKINGEIGRVEGALDSDIAVAQAQVQTLQSSLSATEHQASAENQARVELQSLEANAKSTRTAYESFVSRLREVQGQDAMQLPDASIISRAPVPDSPSSPKRSVIVLASIPVGFLFGLLLAMLQERANIGSAPASFPAQILRAPLLARIPDLALRGFSSPSIVDGMVRNPSSPFARAVAGLDARIAAARGQRAKVVGVSSPAPGEGTTVLAVSLARAAAQRGLRVVLVDTNSAPGIATTLQIDASSPGLSELLSGRAALSQCLARDAASDALILSGGKTGASPYTALASVQMTQLIAYLRRSCDLVVLELPAAYATRAPSHFARLTDAMILLLGWNGSRVPDVLEINALCASMQGRSVGLVLAA
jgi:uncharacterized protein involved in exopolysaccharide biosynthesis/Mrp family chromosome partitioning ATPase